MKITVEEAPQPKGTIRSPEQFTGLLGQLGLYRDALDDVFVVFQHAKAQQNMYARVHNAGDALIAHGEVAWPLTRLPKGSTLTITEDHE